MREEKLQLLDLGGSVRVVACAWLQRDDDVTSGVCVCMIID